MTGSLVTTCPHCGIEVKIVNEADSVTKCKNCGRLWGYKDFKKMREVKDGKERRERNGPGERKKGEAEPDTEV